MKMRLALLGILGSVALSLVGCGPSIDGAAKADIDRRVSALGAPAVLRRAGGFEPMPFAAGQWTRHKLVDDKGQPSFMTYKVLAQEGDAFWLEIVTEAYTGRTMMKMLLAIPNRIDPNSIDIRAVAIKDKNGRVTNLDGPMLSLLRSSYQGALVDARHELAGPSARRRHRPRGDLRGLLPRAHRRDLGPVAQRQHVVVARGRAALGPGQEPGHRQADLDGARRLRPHGRRQRILIP